MEMNLYCWTKKKLRSITRDHVVENFFQLKSVEHKRERDCLRAPADANLASIYLQHTYQQKRHQGQIRFNKQKTEYLTVNMHKIIRNKVSDLLLLLLFLITLKLYYTCIY